MIPENLTPKEAIELQKTLREKVRHTPLAKQPRTVGGCDVSLNRFAKEGYAGFVTLSYPELELVDHAAVLEAIRFPYIPGLLSFREIPMLLGAWEKLRTKPDVLIADGAGIAHPRRMGIAAHLGLELGIPTIGCAKSVLFGTYDEPGREPGSISHMHDPKSDEIIGAALRTRWNVKPVFVSAGHLITLPEAIALVFSCVRNHKLPEPTRLAHIILNEYRIGTRSLG